MGLHTVITSRVTLCPFNGQGSPTRIGTVSWLRHPEIASSGTISALGRELNAHHLKKTEQGKMAKDEEKIVNCWQQSEKYAEVVHVHAFYKHLVSSFLNR